MKKNTQTKIDFDSKQSNVALGQSSYSSSNVECTVISLTSYIENKQVETEKLAIRNTLLGLANNFPKSGK